MMGWDELSEYFKDKTKTFIIIKEGKTGLETKISDDINKLNSAYKKQITAFLEEIIELLKKN